MWIVVDKLKRGGNVMADNYSKQFEEQKGNLKNPEQHKKTVESRKANALIRQQVYQTLRETMLKEDKKGNAYIKAFIEKYMKIAVERPDSKAGQHLAQILLPDNTLSELDMEQNSMMKKNLDFMRFRIMQGYYDKQREVMMEYMNHRRRIYCLCSRRTGKTTLNAGLLVLASLQPETPMFYYNLTVSNAKDQMFEEVLRVAKENDVDVQDKGTSRSEGVILFGNGSSIRFFGNDNKDQARKARGFKARLVIIDEIGHQKNLDELFETLIPLTADYADSTFVLTGTPSRLPDHYSTRLWKEDNDWYKMHWTLFDNPHLPNPKEFVEEQIKSRGLSPDSPFIRREFYGEFAWDTEALIFKTPHYHTNLSFKPTNIVIGVDYGDSAYNAVVSLAYDKERKIAAVIREDKFNHAGADYICQIVKQHYDEARKITPNVQIYADTNAQAITIDMKIKYQLPAYNAYKYDKDYAIDILAQEVNSGRLTVQQGLFLDDEFHHCLYQRDSEDNVIPVMDDQLYHGDIVMALLYAARKMFFDYRYDIKFKQCEVKVDIHGEPLPVKHTDTVGEDIGTVG